MLAVGRFREAMKTDLLIVADRVHMKVYTVEEPAGRSPRPHLVEHFEIEEARDRFSEQYADEAGAFPNGATAGQGNSIGERMTSEAETEMRFFRKLASHLQEVVRQR